MKKLGMVDEALKDTLGLLEKRLGKHRLHI